MKSQAFKYIVNSCCVLTFDVYLQTVYNIHAYNITIAFMLQGEKIFSRVSAQHCCGIEDFQPEPNKYDIVWIQWVTMYISDEDMIDVLQRFQKSLRPNGYIVIKDNVCVRTEFVVDDEDGSVTRSSRLFEEIFLKAGVELIQSKKEKGFPKDLYPLQYFVLQ